MCFQVCEGCPKKGSDCEEPCEAWFEEVVSEEEIAISSSLEMLSGFIERSSCLGVLINQLKNLVNVSDLDCLAKAYNTHLSIDVFWTDKTMSFSIKRDDNRDVVLNITLELDSVPPELPERFRSLLQAVENGDFKTRDDWDALGVAWGEKVWKCDYCEERFTTYEKAELHEKRVHKQQAQDNIKR